MMMMMVIFVEEHIEQFFQLTLCLQIKMSKTRHVRRAHFQSLLIPFTCCNGNEGFLFVKNRS